MFSSDVPQVHRRAKIIMTNSQKIFEGKKDFQSAKNFRKFG